MVEVTFTLTVTATVVRFRLGVAVTLTIMSTANLAFSSFFFVSLRVCVSLRVHGQLIACGVQMLLHQCT